MAVVINIFETFVRHEKDTVPRHHTTPNFNKWIESEPSRCLTVLFLMFQCRFSLSGQILSLQFLIFFKFTSNVFF